MSNHGSATGSPFFFFMVTIVWLAIASVQAGGPNALQNDFYGTASGEFLAGYPSDRGETRKERSGQPVRQSSRFGEANVNVDGRRLTRDEAEKRSRYLRGEEIDRFVRNLDQIGGGNLLRRRVAEAAYELPFWLTPRRNLDQIGGGNLLRSVDERVDRNLDQIGGGNLVRSAITSEDRRRNLDQIGGGNLVRDLAAIEPDP